MSDTPRTDNCIDIADDEGIEDVKFCEVIADFARQLERGLAEAQTEVERLVLEIENQQYAITCASEENQQLKESLAEVRADLRLAKNIIETHVERVAERDKLIEQLKKALESAKLQHYVNDDDNWYSCPASGLCSNDSAGTDCNCGADCVNSIIEAALSAAERGGK